MVTNEIKTDSMVFSERLWSLLLFYRQGNKSTLDRIILKALGRDAPNWSDLALRKTRNLVFRRLNDFGLIEVPDRVKGNWVAQTSSIIPLNAREALIFGDKGFLKSATRHIDRSMVGEHEFYRLPEWVDAPIDLSLCLPKLSVEILEQNLGPVEPRGLTSDVFQYLPNARQLDQKIRKDAPFSITSIGPIERFDFDRMSWAALSSDDVEDDLLRTAPPEKYLGGAIRHFIFEGSASNGRLTELAREVDDWKFFFAAGVFSWKFGWLHEEEPGDLLLPRYQMREGVLPLLLKRLLLLQSFSWPQLDRTHYKFSSIPRNLFGDLIRRFTFLGGADV